MRVLHICQRDDLATGGAARVAVELVKELPRYGVEAECVFVYGNPGPFSKELPGRARHLKLHSSREFLKGLRALRRMIREGGYDIVHHHDGLIWTHLATLTNPKTLKFGHAHLSPPRTGSSKKDRLSHWIQARTYNHLVAVSESTRTDWIASGYPETRSIVISNGVDLNRFQRRSPSHRNVVRSKWNIQEDSKAVGFVGRLDSAMKGCREFIALIASLPENFIGIIAGDGPDRAALETQAKDLGIAGRVRFLGTVDPADAVYPGLDIFVMTSLYEPFGLVLLEAAASGLPIAMIPGSGGSLELGELLRVTLLRDRSINSLAKAVQSITSSYADAFHDTRQSVLEEFSWATAAARLALAYFEVQRPPQNSVLPI